MIGAVDVIGMLVVPVLWGMTNPLIKRGSEGLKHIHGNSRWEQLSKETIYLVTNWKYLLPFAVNQVGSVVFYAVLSSTDVSLAVPLCNSLTFIMTILMGYFLGEDISKDTLLGMAFVIAGAFCCIASRLGMS